MEKRVELPFGPGFRWIEFAPAGVETTIAQRPRRPLGISRETFSAFRKRVEQDGPAAALEASMAAVRELAPDPPGGSANALFEIERVCWSQEVAERAQRLRYQS